MMADAYQLYRMSRAFNVRSSNSPYSQPCPHPDPALLGISLVEQTAGPDLGSFQERAVDIVLDLIPKKKKRGNVQKSWCGESRGVVISSNRDGTKK
jgi:hypothetical protein